jgi:hypothetical protein
MPSPETGPIETNRQREATVNCQVAEIRRALHDGEWDLALQEATHPCDELTAITAADAEVTR